MRNKPWQKLSPSFQRKIPSRILRTRILIVCEGEKTEPNYFKAFPIDNEVVRIDIKGQGANTRSLVEKAIELQDIAATKGTPYNQVWCVFDRDGFMPRNFNDAFSIADKNRIKIAYSNEAFELWYLLHFDYVTSALSRDQYQEKLSERLKKKYEKNSTSMYTELEAKQNVAIKNADKLYASYNFSNPEKDNPSTTVHKLVEELNKFI